MANVDSRRNKIFTFDSSVTPLIAGRAMRLMNKQLWIGLSVATALAVAAEESATINRNHINVRAAPSVNSEVVTRLQKGDKVTFFEKIPVKKPKKDEPVRWAAIKLPEGAKVWVFIPFLE